MDLKNSIVDSDLSEREILLQNPDIVCPKDILERQRVLQVVYWSFDGKLHSGQIVVDLDLEEDVREAFELMHDQRFPLTTVIPVSDKRFRWNDEASMAVDNSSGFNYRKIVGTNTLSNHAKGQAIDLNPRLNPYFRDDKVYPEGATYEPYQPGTITQESPLVTFFRERGWIWGGDWTDRKDYQHFEKPE